MTKLQIERQRAESVGRLEAIRDLPAEQRTEAIQTEERSLQDTVRDLNTQFISACLLEEQNADTKVVEHGADGEDRELRAMLDEADTTAYVDAVLSGHGVTGRELELQQHFRIKANDLPAALLIEQRAVSVATPADVSATQAAPVATPFPTATAEAMGVGRLQVPVGENLFPVVSAPSAGPDDVDEAGTVADTTATITATALKPRRVQVSFTFSREDATTFRGLDAILRERLRNSIADGLDRFALRKTDTGILDHGTDPTAASGVETFERYISTAFAQVDGRWATAPDSLRLLIGKATLQNMVTLYRGNASTETAWDRLTMALGSVMVSANVPIPASNIQQAVFKRGNLRSAVQPIWPAVSLIVDETTGSKIGEITLTALVMTNFAVLQGDAYERHAYRLA